MDRWVNYCLNLRGPLLTALLTTQVVGPADETHRVKTAVAAGLVPVHPSVDHIIPRFDREGGSGGGDFRGRGILGRRWDCEPRE